MERLMDLHTHTIYSDGDKTPKEIVKQGKEIGLTDLAISDHDIIEGLKTLTEEDLEGKQGKILFEKAIKAKMNEMMQEGEIKQVYITSFMVS